MVKMKNFSSYEVKLFISSCDDGVSEALWIFLFETINFRREIVTKTNIIGMPSENSLP